jgi:hypothetical protein
VLAGLSDTVPEPDEPPQATKSVENRHTQMTASVFCADRFRSETEAPERLPDFDEKVFMLGYSVSFAK